MLWVLRIRRLQRLYQRFKTKTWSANSIGKLIDRSVFWSGQTSETGVICWNLNKPWRNWQNVTIGCGPLEPDGYSQTSIGWTWSYNNTKVGRLTKKTNLEETYLDFWMINKDTLSVLPIWHFGQAGWLITAMADQPLGFVYQCGSPLILQALSCAITQSFHCPKLSACWKSWFQAIQMLKTSWIPIQESSSPLHLRSSFH